MQRFLLAIALSLGLLIACIDSQPNWDDTGVTAFAILIVCGLLGAAAPQRPWLWALAVGLWVPVFGIAMTGNFGALFALVFAFVGSYGGMACRRAINFVHRQLQPKDIR